MASSVDSNQRTFTAGGAVAVHLRVKTPTAIAAAGALDCDLGTLVTATATSGDDASVRLRSAAGTTKMVASGAITRGVAVFGAAAGKITSTPNINPIGIALEAATADGNVIEVLRWDSSTVKRRTCEDHTASDTLTVGETGSVHTTVGAGGAVTFTLPAAVVGLEYYFYVGAAQELRIDPDGTETISLPSSGVPGAAGKYLTATIAGETVHLMCCVAGTWACMGYTGTWTAEA